MKTIHIRASREYAVKIGAGILLELGSEISQVCKTGTAAIVSDTNVWPLYGETAKASLEQSGFRVVSFVFPAGEASKTGSTYLSLLNFLASPAATVSSPWAAVW